MKKKDVRALKMCIGCRGRRLSEDFFRKGSHFKTCNKCSTYMRRWHFQKRYMLQMEKYKLGIVHKKNKNGKRTAHYKTPPMKTMYLTPCKFCDDEVTICPCPEDLYKKNNFV